MILFCFFYPRWWRCDRRCACRLRSCARTSHASSATSNSSSFRSTIFLFFLFAFSLGDLLLPILSVPICQSRTDFRKLLFFITELELFFVSVRKEIEKLLLLKIEFADEMNRKLEVCVQKRIPSLVSSYQQHEGTLFQEHHYREAIEHLMQKWKMLSMNGSTIIVLTFSFSQFLIQSNSKKTFQLIKGIKAQNRCTSKSFLSNNFSGVVTKIFPN